MIIILFTCRAIAYQTPTIGAVNVTVQLDKFVRLNVGPSIQTSLHSSTPYELFTKNI